MKVSTWKRIVSNFGFKRCGKEIREWSFIIFNGMPWQLDLYFVLTQTFLAFELLTWLFWTSFCSKRIFWFYFSQYYFFLVPLFRLTFSLCSYLLNLCVFFVNVWCHLFLSLHLFCIWHNWLVSTTSPCISFWLYRINSTSWSLETVSWSENLWNEIMTQP